MSRNLTFFFLGLTAAVVAYIFHPLHGELVGWVITENLSPAFSEMLKSNEIVALASLVSLFGITFVGLYLIFPVFYVWSHINSARNIVGALPLATNLAQRTDKTTFLAKLSGLGLINRLAKAFGDYLTQQAEEDVSGEALKNAPIIRGMSQSPKKQVAKIAPVRASASAEGIFNRDSLVVDNLFFGALNLLARILVAIGVICMGISLVVPSMAAAPLDQPLIITIQPGLVALLYCVTAALIMSAFIHLADMILSQNASSLARGINDLFHQNGWQRDLDDLSGSFGHRDVGAQLENILQSGLNKPMKEITKAVKALSMDQEKKLGSILSKALDFFIGDLDKKLGKDTEILNKALKDAAKSADIMKKQFSDSNVQFTKNMNKQAAVIALHLADMQKILSKSEQTTQKGTDKMITSLSKDLEASQRRLSIFMETSLRKLDNRQKAMDAAATGKDSILNDLQKTAKDMATISNASGTLLDRFHSLSSELMGMVDHIRDAEIARNNGRIAQQGKVKVALEDLKKSNRAKLGDLPDLDS